MRGFFQDVAATAVILVYVVLVFAAVGLAIGTLFAGVAIPLLYLFHHAL